MSHFVVNVQAASPQQANERVPQTELGNACKTVTCLAIISTTAQQAHINTGKYKEKRIAAVYRGKGVSRRSCPPKDGSQEAL